MSEDFLEEALRDANVLAKRISADDYRKLKTHWQNKSFTSVAFMLRKYGIEFKGLTYLETLMEELSRIKK